MKTVGLIILVILGFSIAKKMLSTLCLLVTFLIVYFYFYPESYNAALAYVPELTKILPADLLPSVANPSKATPVLK